MPRVPRIVIPGVVHHVTQRGNNRQDVFFADEDRKVYLALLVKQSGRYGLPIVGFCLMTNHVHLIVRPETEESLAKAIGQAHWHYTQYVNALYGRSGHLWQNRFKSYALDRRHFIRALRYTERNPVRAGMVRTAWDYRWSSAASHVGHEEPFNFLDMSNWDELRSGLNWRDVLTDPMDKQEVGRIRRHLETGRPAGSDRFLAKLERLLGLNLRPQPHGRPRKK